MACAGPCKMPYIFNGDEIAIIMLLCHSSHVWTPLPFLLFSSVFPPFLHPSPSALSYKYSHWLHCTDDSQPAVLWYMYDVYLLLFNGPVYYFLTQIRNSITSRIFHHAGQRDWGCKPCTFLCIRVHVHVCALLLMRHGHTCTCTCTSN